MLSSDTHQFSASKTVITGNSRLSRELRRKHDRIQQDQGKQIWDSPDILPREAWLRRLWKEYVEQNPVEAPILLEASQELALWEQVIRESKDSDVLLDAQATAATAMHAWSILHGWNLAPAQATFTEMPDTQAFYGWMQTIESRLRRSGWLVSSQLPAVLTEKIRTGELIISHPILLAGFDEVIPADQKLFDAIRECGGSASGLPVETSPPQHHRVAALDNTNAEVLQAALWARNELEKNPTAQIGVVILGLASIRTLVDRIFDDVLHPDIGLSDGDAPRAFHISAGIPLPDLAVTSAALQLLNLPVGLSFADFSSLLRSPFLSLDAEELSLMDDKLRRYGATEISFEISDVATLFSSFHEGWRNLPPRQLPSEWSASFSRLLQSAGWPGSRTQSSREFQMIERWNEMLTEYSRLDIILPPLNYRDALVHLQRIAARTIFGSQDIEAPIQIMDTLEAAGSSFDALWIAGLHDRAWPQPAQPNPFLPFSEQKKAGTPQSSADRELDYARRVMDRLLDSAPTVVCSYPKHFEEEDLRMSPLMRDFLPYTPQEVQVESVAQTIFSQAPLMEFMADTVVDLPVTNTPQYGGVRVLEDQAACPFRAFAAHRLNARELDIPESGLSPRERGTILHAALNAIWQVLKSQQNLAVLSVDEWPEFLDQCIREGMETALKGHASAGLLRHRALEEIRLRGLLMDWLKVEMARPPFEVVATEQKNTANIGGLELRVTADRIDRYEDGSYAILDYKTSKSLSARMWDGDRPDAPQLPLYAVNHEGPVSSIRFVQLAAGKAEFIPKEDVPISDRIEEWRLTLEKLAIEFQSGDAQVNPKRYPQTCEYCGLQPLCRIDELRIQDSLSEETDG